MGLSRDCYTGLSAPGRGASGQQAMESSKPQIVLRNGNPAAVILDLDDYQEMLERLEDVDDLKALQVMRKRPLRFKKLEEFF